MKLTIIGYWGAYPERNEATSCYLLEENGFRLLIDCGSGALSQLQNYTELHDLSGLILSHYHHDHIADVGSLQYGLLVTSQLNKRKGTFPIYAHNKDDQFQSLTFHSITEGKSIEDGKTITIGPWEVSFCKTAHPVHCLAMKFKNPKTTKQFVYTADTSWSDQLIPFAQHSDLLICEASLYHEENAEQFGHSTHKMAGKLAQMSHSKKLILTHLPHFGDHRELIIGAKEEFDGDVVLAETGLTFNL